jgi:amino acid transporter
LQDGGSESGNRADFSIFVTVFSYCLLIIILPVLSFFVSKHLLSSFDLTSISQNIYAAVVAVVVLHVALAFYLMKGEFLINIQLIQLFHYLFILAYSSDDKPTPKQTVKQD